MIKTVNAYKLRTNLGEYLDEVYHKGHEVIVERRGKPFVKIIAIHPIVEMDEEKRKDKLSRLIGSLSPKRADEMLKTIRAARRRGRRPVIL